jgi:hypothetical protein
LVIEISSKYLKEDRENNKDCRCGKFLFQLIKQILMVQDVDDADTEEYSIKGMFAIITNSRNDVYVKTNTRLYIPNSRELFAKKLQSEGESESDSCEKELHELLKVELEHFRDTLSEQITQDSELPPFKFVNFYISKV